MKRTNSVSIGKCNFILDEDAYITLEKYLENFQKDLASKESASAASEIMDEVEMRIADLFKEKLLGREVVDKAIVLEVVSQLGLPEGEAFNEKEAKTEAPKEEGKAENRKYRKLFRDPDEKMLGGVCTGLGHYFDVDVVLLRVLFLVAMICAGGGFWVYIVLWIIVPQATTAAEKCAMRGEPATAENIARYSTKK